MENYEMTAKKKINKMKQNNKKVPNYNIIKHSRVQKL